MMQLPDDVLLSAYEGVPGMARPDAAGAAQPTPDGQPGPLYYRPPKRRPARYSRSPDAQHPWELAAQELERFLSETPQKLAEALMPKGRAPFTADAPKGEQVDFWLTRFRLPDGSLNAPAIQEFLDTAEPPAVHALAKAIRERQGEGP